MYHNVCITLCVSQCLYHTVCISLVISQCLYHTVCISLVISLCLYHTVCISLVISQCAVGGKPTSFCDANIVYNICVTESGINSQSSRVWRDSPLFWLRTRESSFSDHQLISRVCWADYTISDQLLFPSLHGGSSPGRRASWKRFHVLLIYLRFAFL